MKRLSASVKKELHTFERNARIQTETLADTSGSAAEVAGATGTKRKKGNKEDDDENAEENEENDEGKLRFAGEFSSCSSRLSAGMESLLSPQFKKDLQHGLGAKLVYKSYDKSMGATPGVCYLGRLADKAAPFLSCCA